MLVQNKQSHKINVNLHLDLSKVVKLDEARIRMIKVKGGKLIGRRELVEEVVDEFLADFVVRQS